MNREAAVQLNNKLLAASATINEAIQIAHDECPEEFKAIRMELANVMASLYLDVLTPHIYRDYPDLDVGRET